MGLFDFLPDRPYLKMRFWIEMGKKLDIDNPKTFNEKQQWLKINDRNPEYTKMVDKYAVREYIKEKLGEDYLIPFLGVWDNFDEIDFDSLPDQFVLKCTHDSGGLVICKDKSLLDKAAARKKINKCLKRNFYKFTREWPYKNVRPRIIAEKLMTEKNGEEIKDFKIHVFDGIPKFILVCSDRFTGNGFKEDFYDTFWVRMEVKRPNTPNREIPCEKPHNLEKMLDLSSFLSKGIPFSRIDFYEIDGKIYFGEITFFPGSGLKNFEPEEWDYKIGEWIRLPESIK